MTDIYIIKWRDAHSNDHWLNIFELIEWQSTDYIIETVGVIINENENYIFMANSIAESTKSGLMAIPKDCIIGKNKIS